MAHGLIIVFGKCGVIKHISPELLICLQSSNKNKLMLQAAHGSRQKCTCLTACQQDLSCVIFMCQHPPLLARQNAVANHLDVRGFNGVELRNFAKLNGPETFHERKEANQVMLCFFAVPVHRALLLGRSRQTRYPSMHTS